jgi:hypothetical protein
MTSSFVEALTPAQVEHLSRMLKILTKYSYALDLSCLGSGKTYIAAAVAQAWRFKRVVVVCPATVESVWNGLFSRRDLPLPDLIETPTVMSYEMFRGSKPVTVAGTRVTLSHGLLSASVATGARPGSVTLAYYPTDRLREICREGCLFVFDESHRAKNASAATHEAVSVVIGTVTAVGGWSRTLLLTGTLFDKREHAFALARLLGIAKSSEPSVFNRATRSVALTGAAEIVAFCKTVVQGIPSSSITPQYGQSYVIDRKSAFTLAFELMTKIVIPDISSCIEAEPEKIARKKACGTVECTEGKSLDCQNLFVKMAPDDNAAFRDAITRLTRVLHYDSRTRTINFKAIRNFTAAPSEKEGDELVFGKSPEARESPVDWGTITVLLMQIESTKIQNLIALAVNKLTTEPNAKVVVVVNYVTSVASIARGIKAALPSENVAVVQGSTSKISRGKTFERFQRPTSDLRVIVANMHVIALGVSLDDQSEAGEWPRYAYASPSYYAVNQHQFVRRFYRMNTRSRATVRYVYGAQIGTDDERICESHLISALSRKASVIKSTLPTGAAENILFADEYASTSEI